VEKEKVMDLSKSREAWLPAARMLEFADCGGEATVMKKMFIEWQTCTAVLSMM
jgi:hypothetical protein